MYRAPDLRLDRQRKLDGDRFKAIKSGLISRPWHVHRTKTLQTGEMRFYPAFSVNQIYRDDTVS